MSVLKSAHVVVSQDENAAITPAMREALSEAYERGVADGRAHAGMATADALEDVASALRDSVARQVDAAGARVKLDAATIVDLAADLASWFVEASVRIDPKALVSAAESVVADMSGRVMVELLVHPSLVEAVSGVAPGNVEVASDPSLGQGDHRVIVGDMTVERVWADAIRDVGPGIAASLEAGA